MILQSLLGCLNIDHQYLSPYGIDGVYGKNHKAYVKKDKAEIHQTNKERVPGFKPTTQTAGKDSRVRVFVPL
jgi:hypothetical protein